MNLHEHLVDLNGDVLKAWLRWAGVSTKGATRKEHFAALIQQELTTNLAEVVGRLPDAERRYLAECAHGGRLPTAREFAARHSMPCPSPVLTPCYGRRPESGLGAFVHVVGWGQRGVSALVEELVEPLKRLLPVPPTPVVRPAGRPPEQVRIRREYFADVVPRPVHVYESERLAPVELGRMLRLALAGKLRLTEASGRPTDSTTRIAAEALAAPDFDLEKPESQRGDAFHRKYYKPAGPVRAHAWPVLLQQCGWARARGGKLELTAAGQALLQRFSPEGFRQGVGEYLGDAEFDELNRIPHIRGQGGKAARYLSDPALRKKAIAGALARLPVGEWIQITELCQFVEASAGAWNVLKTDTCVLYFFEPQYGFITDNTGLGRQFLRAMCLESLATLGVLDVAYTFPHKIWPDLHDSLNGDLPFCGRYDGLLHVRLTPLGAYGLEVSDRYEVAVDDRPRPFRVLPNHDVVFLHGPPDAAERATLELLATRDSDRVWKLDAFRMLSHLEAGGGLGELREFLESNAEGGLPPVVIEFLDQLAARAAACRGHRDAVLIEWADEALAQTLPTSAGMRGLCHHAGGNRLVVPAAKLGAFRSALKRLGYVLPPPSLGGDASPPP